jgi:hypothetical protein
MTQSSMPTQRLNRYTDIPSLLHILRAKQITLLDPKSWDDRNDAAYMQAYKERKGLKTLLALCFSQSNETYHHWRVFASGAAGVCITFKREPLVARLDEYDGVRLGAVNYMTIQDARKKLPDVEQIPFLKRIGYSDEAEFRVIYETQEDEYASAQIEIDLSMIDRVALSPWLHNDLSDATKRAIREIPGCSKLKLSRSTLTSNDEWKDMARRI